jgi:adenylate cyclase, class 2
MPQEIEIKLPVLDLKKALRQIESLGARIVKDRHFEDNILFDTSERSLQQNRMVLRVRAIPGKGLLTLKGKPDTSRGVKEREEIECELENPENLIAILSKLGFVSVFRYQKYRTVYRIEGVAMDICVDETPIGNFIELEGDIENIHEYAGRLGYDRDKQITDSYVSLYHRWCQEKGAAPGHMIFS